VSIIGSASGLGARDRGCAFGPDVLRNSGLEAALRKKGISAAWEVMVHPPDVHGHDGNTKAIEKLCREVAHCVFGVLRRGGRFAVVGGDHSCAIGTWSAAASALRGHGPLGLVWIDAHMDSHTPETSPSGAVHGMPLACLLGYGAPEFTRLVHPWPKLHPQHVCLVGVRSFEEAEAQLLKRIGVRVITMEEVEHGGISWAMQKALDIACTGTAGFGVSIDLDAIDPDDAPGVGTTVPAGLKGQTFIESLTHLTARPGLVGIEIAEFNPLLDRDNRTAHLVRDLLSACLAPYERTLPCTMP
jgi:arginase